MATAQKTRITPHDWSRGSPHVPIAIVEYGDFQDPLCAAARPVLEGLVDRNPSTVRLVFRHFPLISVHPRAFAAAEAAEAAGAQNRFWEMHDILFAHQDALEDDDLIDYAAAIGLDTARFVRECASDAYRTEVLRAFNRGLEDGANATPTLFIDGWRYDGPREALPIASLIAVRLQQRRREQPRL